jgi:hypothetical protein
MQFRSCYESEGPSSTDQTSDAMTPVHGYLADHGQS